jgi:hypothetical protein
MIVSKYDGREWTGFVWLSIGEKVILVNTVMNQCSIECECHGLLRNHSQLKKN